MTLCPDQTRPEQTRPEQTQSTAQSAVCGFSNLSVSQLHTDSTVSLLSFERELTESGCNKTFPLSKSHISSLVVFTKIQRIFRLCPELNFNAGGFFYYLDMVFVSGCLRLGKREEETEGHRVDHECLLLYQHTWNCCLIETVLSAILAQPLAQWFLQWSCDGRITEGVQVLSNVSATVALVQITELIKPNPSIRPVVIYLFTDVQLVSVVIPNINNNFVPSHLVKVF